MIPDLLLIALLLASPFLLALALVGTFLWIVYSTSLAVRLIEYVLRERDSPLID